MTTAVLVLAAGRGERLGASLPKAFVPLCSVPILLRSLATLQSVSEIDSIIPVLGAGDGPHYASLSLEGLNKVHGPVVGGALRQDSMAEGLAALPPETEWVGVHDAARCLVDERDVQSVFQAARDTGAAILAERVRDTIKQVREGQIVATPDRSECWAAQTPQVFRREILTEAIGKARAQGRLATDDAELVEQLGVSVRVVESRRPNPKITFAEDLQWAEHCLSSRGA